MSSIIDTRIPTHCNSDIQNWNFFRQTLDFDSLLQPQSTKNCRRRVYLWWLLQTLPKIYNFMEVKWLLFLYFPVWFNASNNFHVCTWCTISVLCSHNCFVIISATMHCSEQKIRMYPQYSLHLGNMQLELTNFSL